MENELLKTVWEELTYLTNNWNTQDKSDASLRRLSSSLRALLIDHGGTIFKAAKIIKITPRILGDDESNCPIPGTIIHQTSGGKHKGLKVTSFSMINRALSHEEAIKLSTPQKAKKRKPIKLTSFLKTSGITINGTKINREEVIKYVANKLGGNHLDPKRGNPLKNGKLTLEGKYSMLDSHRNLKLADKDAVYFDLLSTGQRVIHSKDIQKIKKKIEKILKERKIL